MKKPQNDNIGLGLASSKEIAKQLKGDIKLQLSKKGLTVFKFKIPIIIAHNDLNVISEDDSFS